MAFIRAREIEGELRNRGPEKGVLYVLQVLAEQQIALQKDMRTLAQSVEQMADIITQFTTVTENMKQAIETIGSDNDDGLDRNTLTLGNDR